MWFALAVFAAILWGIQYSLTEKIVEDISPISVLMWTSLFNFLIALGAGYFNGTQFGLQPVLSQQRGTFWFSAYLVVGVLAEVCVFFSIAKSANATVTSMVEISYPFFVALFTFLILGKIALDLYSGFGGILILAGIFLIYKAKV